MRNKNKKRNVRIRRLKDPMIGLIIKWDDSDPLNATTKFVNCDIDHRNPVRKILAKGIYNNFQLACEHVRMYYRFSITVVFKYDNVVGNVERELKAFCLVNEINELALDMIEDAMREGDEKKFSHVHFEVECLSAHPPAKTIEQKLMEKLEQVA